MKSALLIFMLILVYTLQSFFGKKYSDSYTGNPDSSSYVFTAVTGFFVALCTFCMNGFSLRMEWTTFLLGLVNSVVLILYDVFMIRASRTGPYSILMVFMLSGGILVPAVSSMFFGDLLSVGRWCSVVLIVGSIYLVSRKKDDQKVKTSGFFLFCIGLFLANGFYGALFDIQQRLTGEGEKEGMVIVTFFFAALGALVRLLLMRKGKTWGDFRQNKASGAYLAVSSLIKAGAINLMVYILPLVNVTLLYTFDNAGVLVFSVLASCIFFHEKLSPANLIGCILICLGLIGMTVL